MPRWTEDAKRKQAAQARKAKPWLNSTGPRTAAGKAKVAHNALRHGGRSAAIRRLRGLLRRQRDFLALVKAYEAYEKNCAKPRPGKSTGYLTFQEFFAKQSEQTATLQCPLYP